MRSHYTIYMYHELFGELIIHDFSYKSVFGYTVCSKTGQYACVVGIRCGQYYQ